MRERGEESCACRFASCQESLQAHEPRVKSLSYCASSLSSPTRVLYRMPRSVPGLHHACMHSDFRFPSRERQEPRTWPGGQGQGPWRRGHQRRRVRSCWWWAATSPRSWAAPESPRCSCASRARRCLSSLLVNILPSFPRCSRSTFAPHNALSGPNFSEPSSLVQPSAHSMQLRCSEHASRELGGMLSTCAICLQAAAAVAHTKGKSVVLRELEAFLAVIHRRCRHVRQQAPVSQSGRATVAAHNYSRTPDATGASCALGSWRICCWHTGCDTNEV